MICHKEDSVFLTGETRPAAVSVSASYDGYGRLISCDRSGDATLTHVYNVLRWYYGDSLLNTLNYSAQSHLVPLPRHHNYGDSYHSP